MGRSLNISAVVAVVVVIVMVAVELIVGSFPVSIFRFPVNFLCIALWLLILGHIYRERATSHLARFMLSARVTWLSLALVAAVGIFLGLERKPSSDAWPVVAAILFVLSHLVLITLRGWRNAHGIRWRFMLLHLGLILALGAGFWGTPDREQLRIAVGADPSDEAYTMDGTMRLLGYTLRLEDYDITLDDSGAPQHYEAIVDVDGHRESIRINHPYSRSWQESIYLISLGHSATGDTYCILEVVCEPWQWLSKAGIVMLIMGAVGMFLRGPRRGSNDKREVTA